MNRILLGDADHRRRLYIFHGTVRSHVDNILGKMGVNSRHKAVALARAQGLIP